jgi:hypothetical protein
MKLIEWMQLIRYTSMERKGSGVLKNILVCVIV